MLLTSGQISMTITSSIVFIFTTLLFLSGYALQQQTVRSLQAAIRPPLPPPLATSTPFSDVRIAKPFGTHSGPDENLGRQHASYSRVTTDWTRLAYVQLLRRHVDVCSAVMLFAELERQNSNAHRILLYPKSWEQVSTSHQQMSTYIQTSLRLLKKAEQRFQVELLPIEPMADTGEDLEASYPIAGLLSLTRFQRILLLQPSGFIINAVETDKLLTVPTNSTITSFEHSSSALILKPSKKSFREVLASNPASSVAEHSGTGFKSVCLIENPYAVTQSSDLGLQGEAFNSTLYYKQAGYIRLSDPAILGPEYDTPRNILRQSQPDALQAQRTWVDMYEIFRIRRMDVCGLDLEPMPKIF